MRRSLQNLLAAVAAFLSCLASPFSSSAATANVLVGSGGLVFSPATTNIAVGDRVIWTWGGPVIPHSTTSGTIIITTTSTNKSPDGLWDSGVAVGAHSFTNTFGSAGSFPYYCQVHYTNGMAGTIIVTGLPPVISITNPVSGAVFSTPANITIQASASDSDGTVTNVQFLIGAIVLTNDSTVPFSAVTNNLAAGNYTLSAIASDDHGVTATNAVAISVVTPLPLVISAPQLSSASFQFSYAANPGLNYVVQLATNLDSPDWIPVSTNTAAGNPVVFVANHATNNAAFYRVGLLPNP